MKNITWLVLSMMLCACLSLNAQYKTRIGGGVSNFYSPTFLNTGFSIPIKAVGASLQHSFYRGLGVKASYQRWFDPFSSYVGSRPFEVRMVDKNYKIHPRWNYQMVDIGGVYNELHKRHEIFADLGCSITTGNNYVISVFQFPGYPDRLEFGETHNVTYAGLKYELGYNYLLFKNRVNAGLSVSSRNYFGKDAFTQYNLNLNFGYNFNLLNRKTTENKK